MGEREKSQGDFASSPSSRGRQQELARGGGGEERRSLHVSRLGDGDGAAAAAGVGVEIDRGGIARYANRSAGK